MYILTEVNTPKHKQFSQKALSNQSFFTTHVARSWFWKM